MRRTKWFAAMLVGLAFACGEGTVERPAGRVTALEQSNDSADLEVTKNIRQALIASSSLSTGAQNVTVVTTPATVVVQGVVASESERSAVAAVARQHAGGRTVSEDLEIQLP